MKVGKETTFGLLQALDEYGVKEDKVSKKRIATSTYAAKRIKRCKCNDRSR